jgi:hypothetical protein
LFYGTKQDANSQSTLQAVTPDEFSSTKFETLRSKYHADYGNDGTINGSPKVVLDVTGVSLEMFFTTVLYNIHRPSLRVCRAESEVRHDEKVGYPLIIQHHIGSFERYNKRSDERRSREVSCVVFI